MGWDANEKCAKSAVLGDRVSAGGQVGITSVNICSDVQIAAKAGVTKDIVKPGVISGYPANEHRTQLHYEATLRRLACGKGGKK